MRDFERLEELSSVVRSGLKANAVIWAIDQVLAGATPDERMCRSLTGGGEILRALASPEKARAQGSARRSQNMLGGESARKVRSAVVLVADLGEDEGSIDKALTDLAETLDALAAQAGQEPEHSQLEVALEVFTEISEFELGQANGIVHTRKRAPWLPRTTTSISS